MSLKSAALLATLAVASAAASADTAVGLAFDGVSQYSGTFAAAASGTNTFTVDLSALTGLSNITLVSAVTANFSGPLGYDVTSVTFDGIAYTPVANITVPGVFGADAWTYQGINVTAGLHTLVVTGNLIGGTTGFNGTINIQAQPVPEPESYALLLAGLGAVGMIARRRSNR